jgi:hypothetical protein
MGIQLWYNRGRKGDQKAATRRVTESAGGMAQEIQGEPAFRALFIRRLQYQRHPRRVEKERFIQFE